jgi:hypothetical protein
LRCALLAQPGLLRDDEQPAALGAHPYTPWRHQPLLSRSTANSASMRAIASLAIGALLILA